MKTNKTKIAKTIRKAKKETEKKVSKKLIKANKTKIARVLKVNKVKIDRLLKANNARVDRKIRENNTRIKEVLTGARRKSQPKNRPVQSPFDLTRFRGKRKKETNDQRLKRASGNVYSVRDKILYGIATGAYKFKWSSIAKEAGYKSGEQKRMLSLLSNNGYSIKGLAHHIWEENGGSYGRGPDDDVIRDEIIDVLQTVSTRTDALNQLDRIDSPF